MLEELCLERLRGLCGIVVSTAKRFGDDFIYEPEFFRVIRGDFQRLGGIHAARRRRVLLLADVDLGVLKQLIQKSYAKMAG